MIAVLMVIFGVVARVLPHLPNFSPVAATSLFGGTYLDKRLSLALPILVMVISDFFIGFDSITSRLTVYGSFLLIGAMGLWLRSRKSVKNVILASVASSVSFFLITNFGVWLWSGMYPHTAQGLSSAYVLAIPFFRNTLIGDLFYTAVFFGTFELFRLALKKTRFAHLAKV